MEEGHLLAHLLLRAAGRTHVADDRELDVSLVGELEITLASVSRRIRSRPTNWYLTSSGSWGSFSSSVGDMEENGAWSL